MFNLGPMEVLVIAVIALLVLGPQRLPEAMRQAGKGIGEVRRWSSQLTNEVQSAFVAAPAPSYPTPATDAAPVAAGAPDTAPAQAPGADAGAIGA